MAKRGGFFAEMERQAKLSAQRQQAAQRQSAQAHARAVREAEQAQRQSERAAAQAGRAAAADAKAAEREAKRLHVEAREAEVAVLNAELADQLEQIDGTLAATLDVDDFVDLESLRQVAVHPPFNPGEWATPFPAPAPIPAPPEPQWIPPPEPKGISSAFGGKKRFAEQLAQARTAFAAAHQAWQYEMSLLPGRGQAQQEEYQRAEANRVAGLQQMRDTYDTECQRRDAEAQEANAALDELINNLAYNVEEAVQEYVAIVLANSAYPECIPVEHDFTYDSQTRELTLGVSIPPPTAVPSTAAYKYVKAKDEITASPLTQAAMKQRYLNLVAQVSLRSLHEVFEADRAERIQTISLTITTEAMDPGLGQMTVVPLAAVATDRATFSAIELRNVEPLATMKHLKALVSKNPLALDPIDIAKSIRG